MDKTDTGGWLDKLEWVSRYRSRLAALPLVLAVFCFYRECENDAVTWTVGPLLILAGFALRVWAQQHIQRRLRGPGHLTTSGPYAFVRNPLYIGNIMLCTGGTVLSELLWLVPIVLLWWWGIYSLVVRYEEACLLRRYSKSYQDYMQQTPRWWPRLVPLGEIGLITKHLWPSLRAEFFCLCVLLPYLFKEVISPWVEG